MNSVADDADMQAAACCARQAGLAHARHFALSPSALLQKDAEFRPQRSLRLLSTSSSTIARKPSAKGNRSNRLSPANPPDYRLRFNATTPTAAQVVGQFGLKVVT